MPKSMAGSTIALPGMWHGLQACGRGHKKFSRSGCLEVWGMDQEPTLAKAGLVIVEWAQAMVQQGVSVLEWA